MWTTHASKKEKKGDKEEEDKRSKANLLQRLGDQRLNLFFFYMPRLDGEAFL